MLNVKQIVDEGLLLLETTQGKPAQVGYDLSLKAVQKIGNKIGGAYNLSNNSKIGKVLKDKTELNEGCKIPDNRVAFIKQRSSLYRNGAIINSPVFDPGFETQNMGTLLYVYETIFIEKDARVAQIYFHECNTAEKYNGQWQNDKQRSSL